MGQRLAGRRAAPEATTDGTTSRRRRSADLDAAARADVFGGNAERVYLERDGEVAAASSERGRSIPADEHDRRGHHRDEEHERP